MTDTTTSSDSAGQEAPAGGQDNSGADASQVLYGSSDSGAGEADQNVGQAQEGDQSQQGDQPQEGNQQGEEGQDSKKGILSEGEKDSDNQESSEEDSDNQESNDSEDSQEQQEQEPSYDFEPPENIQVDEDMKTQFQEIAKEEQLSEEAAKKLWDLGMQQIQNSDPNQWVSETIEKNREQWVGETTKDSEIGGDNLETTRQNAKLAVRQFGNEKFFDVLEKSGLESHPEVVRFLNKVGQNLGEDQNVQPGTGANQRSLTPAEILYGKNN
jgi:hypothetical protein